MGQGSDHMTGRIVAPRRAMLAALSVFAGSALLRPLQAMAATRFAPPDGPMRFTRTLTRQLGVSDRAVFERSFVIRFHADGTGGYRVEGQQADVTVQVPPALEALAAMERRRVETGVFPIALSPGGLILDGPSPEPMALFPEAVATAMRQLATMSDRSAAEAARHYLQNLAARPDQLLSRIPADLFAPVETRRQEARAFPLEDGGVGRIDLSFEATIDPACGMMLSAIRKVSTHMGSSERVTSERFTLARS